MDSGYLCGSGSIDMTYPTPKAVKELREKTGISVLQARQRLVREHLLEEMEKVKTTESHELRIRGLAYVVEYLVTQLPG